MTGRQSTTCGFVALIGATNAGKSTLINRLVGEKVSIVSRKVQTTRSRVCGIVIHDKAQIIFVDTPGMFVPKKRLERSMVDSAMKTMGECEQVVLVVDVSNRKVLEHNMPTIEKLKSENKKAVLCLNKIDCVEQEVLLKLADDFYKTEAFSDVLMISALKGNGVDELVDLVAEQLPSSPWLYPDDMVSDMPMRLVAAEVTREKIFDRLHQEIPYAITVETEKWEEKQRQIVIEQVIYVQKDGQKAIVLGKGGQAIKAIGIAARKELEEALGKPVRLNLFVKVREKWMEDSSRYSLWGLEFDV